MEENYTLEKEYAVSPDIFDKAYKSYQKKFVYLKSYIFMGIFLLLAADFIWAAAKNPGNTLVYLLIVVCIALAFREWHNPRFIRRRLYETVRDMGKVVYKIGVGDGFIDISTVDDGTSGDDEDGEDGDSGKNAEEASAENAEDTEENDDISPEAEELMPEKIKIEYKRKLQSS